MIQNKNLLKAVPFLGAFVLCACQSSIPASRVTYDLLWDTKLEKIENHVKLLESSDGIPTICKTVGDVVSNDFKVLMFTDTHLDHKKPQCNYTFTMIAKNIMAEKPDLVIFGGDNITSCENEPRAKQFCQMLEDLNVYWSCCLGNHEGDQGKPELGEKGMTRPEMVKLFDSYPHCLLDSTPKTTKAGLPVRGNGNNAIHILNSEGKIAETLFFLDTDKLMSAESMEEYKKQIQKFKDWGKADADETEFYDYIHDSQIGWYKEVMEDSNSLNSIVVSHVPLLDMEDAYLDYYKAKYPEGEGYQPQDRCGNDNFWPYTSTPDEVTTISGDKIKLITGCRTEGMCYSPYDLVALDEFGGNGHTPIFNAMLDYGGEHPAFFCGHDHSNDFFLEVKPKANEDKTVTMGYIESGCYSSNNYWSKGLLNWDPYKTEYMQSNHLTQGYSILNLSLDKQDEPFEVANCTNYDKWTNLYKEALDLVKANRGDYKPAWDYDKGKSKYPNDPNDPLAGGPPTLI